MPLRIPARTRACRIGSRCRGGSVLRAARALADTGRPCAWIATSTTAVMARSPLRDSNDMTLQPDHKRAGNKLQATRSGPKLRECPIIPVAGYQIILRTWTISGAFAANFSGRCGQPEGSEASGPYLGGGRHDSPPYPGVEPPVEPNPPLPRVVWPSWVGFATVRLTRE